MKNLAPYLKAILAAIVAGLSSLAGQLVAGQSLGDVTAGGWVAVAIAFFVALGAVFAVPNSTGGSG